MLLSAAFAGCGPAPPYDHIAGYKASFGVDFAQCGNAGTNSGGCSAEPDYQRIFECVQDHLASCQPAEAEEVKFTSEISDNDSHHIYLVVPEGEGCQLTLFINYVLGNGAYRLHQRDCSGLDLSSGTEDCVTVSPTGCGPDEEVTRCDPIVPGVGC